MPDTENVDLKEYIEANLIYFNVIEHRIMIDAHLGNYIDRGDSEVYPDFDFFNKLHPNTERSEEAQLIADSRLISVLKMLVLNYPELPTIGLEMVTDTHLIDMFIKLPDKRYFAIMLRSNGNGKVKWRDDNKSFYISKPGKNPSKWTSANAAIKALKSTIVWKDRSSPFLGSSKKERKRPIIKVIVLCHGTKLNPNNAPELWDTFGEARVLRVYDETLVFVVEQDDLIKFFSPVVDRSDQNRE